ncbi:MAG: hypothetical protein FWC57_00530, partial [Endomicrobia bacterium]|nr:hypothetical protein [Endomicrobiia bacterium]
QSFCPAVLAVTSYKEFLSVFYEIFVFQICNCRIFLGFLIFIVLAMLLYIGLLRLFDSPANNKLSVNIRRTGFAF